MKGKDIVVVGLQPWDIEIGSNCKNIALEFARENRVLYVNPPLDINTLLRKRRSLPVKKRIEIRESGKNLNEVSRNLWNLYPQHLLYSINWIPSTPLFSMLNRINGRKFSADISKAIKLLGFDNIILFNDSDMFRSFHLKEHLKPGCSIYYCRDNLLANPYWSKHGKTLEPALMAKSDLVVANSAYLTKMAEKHNSNSVDVGQGCDLMLFEPGIIHEVPADLKAIAKPIIGYIGAITSSRLDLKLLEFLCTTKIDWSFVFIGKPEGEFIGSALSKLTNAHFLGSRDVSQLPAYLAGFDVAINPQVLNEFTVGNYPRKIDEYLSMGKPVVATKTQTMEMFKDHVYLADVPEDYLRQIEEALRLDSPQLHATRHHFAASHTWNNSVQSIYRAIEAVMQRKHQ